MNRFQSWNLQLARDYINSRTGSSFVVLKLAKRKEAKLLAAVAAAGLC